VNGSKAAAHSTSAAVTGNQLLVSSSGYTYDQSTKQVQADNIRAKVNLSGAAIVPTGSTMPANGIYFPAANTIALATNSVQAWRVDSNGYMISDLANYALIQGSAWTSTSGTSHSWTGIPSWAKKITIIFKGVSTTAISSSTNSRIIIQVGHGTATASGYATNCGAIGSGANNTNSSGSVTSGFPINGYAMANATTFSGTAVITNVTGNVWVCSGVMADTSATSAVTIFGGDISLGSSLDMVQVTTVGGTDTFDAGSVNILVE
jgi:hypothetical protein